MAASEVQAPEEPQPKVKSVIDEVLQEMPASFLCPLSKEVMTDPVLLMASGHTYERAALAKHFMQQALLNLQLGTSLPQSPTAKSWAKRYKKFIQTMLKPRALPTPSPTFTEPTTGQKLTKFQILLLVNNLALRTAIKQFFVRSADRLKVRG
jgi:hypothetical protein